MSYNVFLTASLGAPRNHHALFVETDPSSKSGMVFNVIGNIQTGMIFEERRSDAPEASDTFVEKSYLGDVKAENVDRLREICRGNPAPKKQFDGAKRLYPKEPLRRCQEWTAETIDWLSKDGVLLLADNTVIEPPMKGEE